jgi:DNA-binding NtrC family response regulator
MSRLKVVYVVDHDPVSRSRIRRLLARPGWSFRTLEDARQAWAGLDALHPDLIVADLHLPDIDGLALLQAVHHRDPSIRTILAAAGEMPAAARRALDTGTIDGLAAKPLDENLARMARQLLEGPDEDDWLPRAM